MLPSTPGSSKWSFFHQVSKSQDPVCASILPHAPPTSPSSYGHPNNILWAVQIMESNSLCCSPVVCYFHPLRPNTLLSTLPSTPSVSVLPLTYRPTSTSTKTTLFSLSHRKPERTNEVPVPVPVPTAWRLLRLRMEETVAANILNKQLRTATKGHTLA